MKKWIVMLGLLACSFAHAQEAPIVVIKDKPITAPGTPALKQWWRQAVTPDKVDALLNSPGGPNSVTTRTGVNANPQPNALVMTPCANTQIEVAGICVCPGATVWDGTACSVCPPVVGNVSVSPSSLNTAQIAYWTWAFSGGSITSVSRTCTGATSFGATAMSQSGVNVAWGAPGLNVGVTTCTYTGTNSCGSSISAVAAVNVSSPPCTTTGACPPGTSWSGSTCAGNYKTCTTGPTTSNGYDWYNLNTAAVGPGVCPVNASGTVAPGCGACPVNTVWNGASCVPVPCPTAGACPGGTAWNGAQCRGNLTNCTTGPTTANGYSWYNLNTAAAGPAVCPVTASGTVPAGCGACPVNTTWNGSSCVPVACTIGCPGGTSWNGSQCRGNLTSCTTGPTTSNGYDWYNPNTAAAGPGTCPIGASGQVGAGCGSCPANTSWNGSSCAAVGCNINCPAATGWADTVWNAVAKTCDHPNTVCGGGTTLTAAGQNYWNINVNASGPGTCPTSSGELVRTAPACATIPSFICPNGTSAINVNACANCASGGRPTAWGTCPFIIRHAVQALSGNLPNVFATSATGIQVQSAADDTYYSEAKITSYSYAWVSKNGYTFLQLQAALTGYSAARTRPGTGDAAPCPTLASECTGGITTCMLDLNLCR